jgi:hypothetical protein
MSGTDELFVRQGPELADFNSSKFRRVRLTIGFSGPRSMCPFRCTIDHIINWCWQNQIFNQYFHPVHISNIDPSSTKQPIVPGRSYSCEKASKGWADRAVRLWSANASCPVIKTNDLIYRVEKKFPAPFSVEIHDMRKTISYLFNNIFFSIAKNPCKTAHPVVEAALHFIESEVTPDLRNRPCNFIARVKFAIFQDSLQQSNSKDYSCKGSCLVNRVGSAIPRHDAFRILMPFLIHRGLLNCFDVPEK